MANQQKKSKTEKEYEFMSELIEKYGLDRDIDIHTQVGKNGKFQYAIIKRTGIEKIEAKESIDFEYEWIIAEKDCIVLDCFANFKDLERVVKDKDGNPRPIRTTGEASAKNSNSPYYAAMAEKRGKHRAILKLLDLYKYGVYSEDEADDFKGKGNYNENDL